MTSLVAHVLASVGLGKAPVSVDASGATFKCNPVEPTARRAAVLGSEALAAAWRQSANAIKVWHLSPIPANAIRVIGEHHLFAQVRKENSQSACACVGLPRASGPLVAAAGLAHDSVPFRCLVVGAVSGGAHGVL